MKGPGKMTKCQVLENLYLLMELQYIKNLKMIKLLHDRLITLNYLIFIFIKDLFLLSIYY